MQFFQIRKLINRMWKLFQAWQRGISFHQLEQHFSLIILRPEIQVQFFGPSALRFFNPAFGFLHQFFLGVFGKFFHGRQGGA
ncbi:hypothetical protein [Hymenobacter terrigena]